MDDVTDQVLAVLKDDMTEDERNAKIKEISKEISDKAVEGTYYKAYVADMFNSNQFFVFVYVIYRNNFVQHTLYEVIRGGINAWKEKGLPVADGGLNDIECGSESCNTNTCGCGCNGCG